MLVFICTMYGAPIPLKALRNSFALFTTKWITLNLPSHECSGPQRPHLDLGRSPYFCYWDAHIWTRRWSVRSLLYNILARGLKFYYFLYLLGSKSFGTKKLFTASLQNSFFEALLHEKFRCSALIQPNSANMVSSPFPGRPTVPLPKKLFL